MYTWESSPLCGALGTEGGRWWSQRDMRGGEALLGLRFWCVLVDVPPLLTALFWAFKAKAQRDTEVPGSVSSDACNIASCKERKER
jgi:hypothetical protein